LVEHSRTALPPALAALGQAQADSTRGTADAAESWARAVGDTGVASPLPSERRPAPEPTPSPAPADAPAVSVTDRPRPQVQPQAQPERTLAAPPDLRERRRRLIVAGLSPLPREE